MNKRERVLSIRVSDEELAQLKEWAGDDRKVSAVVRNRLFPKPQPLYAFNTTSSSWTGNVITTWVA